MNSFILLLLSFLVACCRTSQANDTNQHLLELLEPINCPAIQSATLLTLVCALLSTPQNTRTFEALDGLLTVTSLFKSRSTSRGVKLKLVEFLYFYLMPETPEMARDGTMDTWRAGDGMMVVDEEGGSRREKRQVVFDAATGRRMVEEEKDDWTRSTEEKTELLGRFLGRVDDLVADLKESAPFGGVGC